MQSWLCSSNRLEMASKRVKIVISKIDKKDKMKEYSLETPSTNNDILASKNARKFFKKQINRL